MGDLLDLFNAYRVPAQHLSSIVLGAAIWRWGGNPERWLIGIFIATMVVPVNVAHWLDLTPGEFGPGSWAAFMIDMLATVMFVGIALNANRNYPLWIAGFQLVAIGSHLVPSMVSAVSPLAIAVLVIGPSYCQLLLIFGGFVRHAQRERRFGSYREWRLASPGLRWLRP